MPQENGNKTDLRWLELQNTEGYGLLVAGTEPFQASVHHYSAEALAKARHTYELEREETITLNIDHAQCGLGNGSCGPGVLPQYLLEEEEYRFSLHLRGVRKSDSPAELGRQAMPYHRP
jgi:hypothetical protein